MFKKLPNLGGNVRGDLSVSAIMSSRIKDVQIINTHSEGELKQGGWAGRTAAGALIAGPLGAVIGAVTRKSSMTVKGRVMFRIDFADGDSYLTEADAPVFNRIYARAAQQSGKDNGGVYDYTRLKWFIAILAIVVIGRLLS